MRSIQAIAIHSLFFTKASLRIAVGIVTTLMVISCTSQSTHHVHQPGAKYASKSSGKKLDPHKIEALIRAEYEKWKGTKHRLGGQGAKGIDCSAFVQVVYKSVFDVGLPRATEYQVKEGVPVRRKHLVAGDLVFFKPPSYPRHVGIYLSNSDFVHASKSKGVVISSMEVSYWKKSYWTARRILN